MYMCVYVSTGGSIRSVVVNYFIIKMGTCHFGVSIHMWILIESVKYKGV